MKLTFILICIFSIQTFANHITAQEKITLELQKSSLKKAFRSIQRQTSFRFIYNDDMLPARQDVSINVHGESLSTVMEKLLERTGLSYKILSQNMIVISERTTTISNTDLYALDIAGKVVNEKNEPLSNVSILEKGTNNGTVTKDDGTFSMHVASSNSVLVVSSVNFLSQEVKLGERSSITIQLKADDKAMDDVVIVGYGTKKKESITAAVASISAKDIENSHGGSTVSTALAGKIPGVSFRMSDGRPGASAAIQIRNMGTPLYVIDGIQQDEGQFNNIAPNDIETITVLKDASAAIYGVRAANGVVVVTTKRGKLGSRNTVSANVYTGWQNWSRFPKTVNAYEYNLGKVESDINQKGVTTITRDDIAKYKEGKVDPYRSFDWYDFIVKKNAPLTSYNLNFTGGTDKVNYYVSGTHIKQYSVLGREFTFERTNLQSNIDARIGKHFKIGMQINGRVETRDNPGVPGGDDYWEARFAILRNTPMECPYANDNPAYVNNIGHNNENWAFLNKKLSGYWHQDWRVLQTNLTAEYQTPLKGLSFKGLFSYYYANQLLNGHEYTYNVYTYNPVDSSYKVTGGSTNPWRERRQQTILSPTWQVQANYNNTFGLHTVGVTLVNERIRRRDINTWVHAVPSTNVLPLIYFNTMDTYQDADDQEARIGYIGRINYNYANKYFLEVSARRDGSWKFAPDRRWGTFPSISGGWRISQEDFFQNNISAALINELKVRASYGSLGDDNINMNINPGDPRYITAYAYQPGYNYNTSTNIMDQYDPATGNVQAHTVVTGARDKGVLINNISWFTSKVLDIGLDYGMLNGQLSGAIDFFKRKRSGLRGRKYDILVPSEIGYALPDENVNSDQVIGGEFSIAYKSYAKEFNYTVGGNISYARQKDLSTYKPVFNNSWDHYRNSREERWNAIFWGLEYIGQFKSQDEINNYSVDVDGHGNKSLLPGDFIYKDQNQDGLINEYDKRPIGYPTGKNPILSYGINLAASYKGFDFTAVFSGGGMYSYNRYWEMRWPYQNGGALQTVFYNDRWHREDPFDVNSKWIPGKYPSLRYNTREHSNYNQNSTFWLTNIRYLRCRTLELGYSLPSKWLDKIRMQKARFYVNTNNLFSIDNTHQYGIDAEIIDDNGLTYPQSKYVNVGCALSF